MNRAGGFLLAVTLASCALTTTGCGPVYYGITASAAESRLDEAHKLGAEKLAIYDYTLARRTLKEAAMQASRASYSDAADLAEVAEQHAIKAIDVTRARKGLPPRKAEEDEAEVEAEPTEGTPKKAPPPPPTPQKKAPEDKYE